MIRILPLSGKLIAALLCLPPLVAVAGEPSRHFTGEARSLEDGSLYYSETHQQVGECRDGFFYPSEHAVVYRTPDEEVIARKTLDYGVSAQRPSYELIDERFDERMRVDNEADRSARIEWRTPEGEEKNFRASIPGDGVIDAGFDGLVASNWEQLSGNGQRVRISFLAPTRGEFYDFEARPASNEALIGEHQFRIRPRGWISRWFVDDIYLAYDDERLLRDYYGLTNIRESADENFTAHIRYDYHQTPDC